MDGFYSTPAWRHARARALARDGSRCTVARWLGGACAPGPLHVHHIHARHEGGDPYDLANLATSCAAHHPMWEALRLRIVDTILAALAPPPRCPHRHVSRAAREQCERRLARRSSVAA